MKVGDEKTEQERDLGVTFKNNITIRNDTQRTIIIIIWGTNNNNITFTIDNSGVDTLLFADDQTILSNSESRFQITVHSCIEYVSI